MAERNLQFIEYYNKHLSMAREVGEKAGEGATYVYLGNVYYCQGKFKKPWSTTIKAYQ